MVIDRCGNFVVEMINILGNEVGQIGIFGVVPALLDGIEFWGIGGKPFELEPIGMML